MTKKVKTSIAIDRNLLDWIAEMIKRKRFASNSHAIEYSLQRLIEQEREDIHFGIASQDKSRAILSAKCNQKTHTRA